MLYVEFEMNAERTLNYALLFTILEDGIIGLAILFMFVKRLRMLVNALKQNNAGEHSQNLQKTMIKLTILAVIAIVSTQISVIFYVFSVSSAKPVSIYVPILIDNIINQCCLLFSLSIYKFFYHNCCCVCITFCNKYIFH